MRALRKFLYHVAAGKGGWDIMMVAVFTSMVLALVAARWAPRWLALAALVVCLALSTREFLYEIESPVDGFRMPWPQAMIHGGRPA